MTEDRILGFMGLAMRAGKVICGFDAVCNSLKKREVKLLIFAGDISRNTLDKLLTLGEKCIELPDAYSFSTAGRLGDALGKSPKAVIGISDDGFARKLSEMLNDFDEEGNN